MHPERRYRAAPRTPVQNVDMDTMMQKNQDPVKDAAMKSSEGKLGCMFHQMYYTADTSSKHWGQLR